MLVLHIVFLTRPKITSWKEDIQSAECFSPPPLPLLAHTHTRAQNYSWASPASHPPTLSPLCLSVLLCFCEASSLLSGQLSISKELLTPFSSCVFQTFSSPPLSPLSLWLSHSSSSLLSTLKSVLVVLFHCYVPFGPKHLSFTQHAPMTGLIFPQQSLCHLCFQICWQKLDGNSLQSTTFHENPAPYELQYFLALVLTDEMFLVTACSPTINWGEVPLSWGWPSCVVILFLYSQVHALKSDVPHPASKNFRKRFENQTRSSCSISLELQTWYFSAADAVFESGLVANFFSPWRQKALLL